jgi:hypothetical protein
LGGGFSGRIADLDPDKALACSRTVVLGSVPCFLAEVARLLPLSHLLYVDIRRCDHFAQREAELDDAPMRMLFGRSEMRKLSGDSRRMFRRSQGGAINGRAPKRYCIFCG